MAVGLSGSQRNMIGVVKNLGRGFARAIPVGPNEKDVLGRQLDLNPKRYSHLFTANGKDVSRLVKDFHGKLKTDEPFRLNIQAALAGYDIRMENAEDAFWVLVSQAYAKSLVDKTGRRDGHIIHLGGDGYGKHYLINSLSAYTLIRSGICDNGGGIIYWGITDGGSMKHMPMLQRAQTGEGGNWLYGTVSHSTKDVLSGEKMGMSGEVMCTDLLMNRIFDVILEGRFLPLKPVKRPEEYVVTVGNTIPFRTAVAENVIRARTTVKESVPVGSLLEGLDVAVPMEDNPIMQMSGEIIGNLGATVIPIATGGRSVFDPHESGSENVRFLAKWAEESGEKPIVFIKDPDGDRVSAIFVDQHGRATNVKGTMLAALAAHNLATYNPLGLKMGIVADMRAFLSVNKLGEGLNANGHPIEIIPSSPGYNSFHEMIAKYDAAAGIEETSHTMIRPYDHRAFGAPEHHTGVQGGDNAGLFGYYLLALTKYMWEGRDALQQLEYLRDTFKMPKTNPVEFKPKLPVSHGMAKVVIADAIKEIADASFGRNPSYRIVPLDTGAYIYNNKLDAAVLIRHSKSGSSFTINCEYKDGDTNAEVFTKNLGVAIMLKAAETAKIKMSDSRHKFFALRDFPLDMGDAAGIASGISNPDGIIAQATLM